MIEHATTLASVDYNGDAAVAPTPVPPDGDGWRPNGRSAIPGERWTCVSVLGHDDWRCVQVVHFYSFWWREVLA